MTLLLDGVRVIESSMLLNGATTTMMLADLGADVIKIESPFLGDYIRAFDTAHMHRQTNKGKRSIAADLKTDQGREILHRLIATADVFVTNAIGDRNAKLSIDHASLKAIKPDLVYCQNTGYGATGPYCGIPTHGQMMDALAGAMPVEMGDDGLVEPSGKYVRRTGSLASAGEGTALGAIYAAYHIAAALVHRDRTGEGAFIDLASTTAVLANAWVAAVAALDVPGREGWWQDDANTRSIARYQAYRTKDDRYLLFCPEERKFWHGFLEVVGRQDLRDQERGLDLRREIQVIIKGRTLDEWMDIAIAHNLPIGPIHDGIEEVCGDPQIAARGIIAEKEGHHYIRQPALVDGKPSQVGGPPPELGQHNDELLAELGYSPDEILALRGDTVIEAPERDAGHISRAIYGHD